MKFIIHRGTHEIGGSCVEVCHGNTRIIIDIGMPLDGSGYGIGRELIDAPGNVQSLIGQGGLPDVRGLYSEVEGKDQVDAVLISHPHQDHYGLLGHLSPQVPVYAGEYTLRLIEKSSFFIRGIQPICNHQRIIVHIYSALRA